MIETIDSFEDLWLWIEHLQVEAKRKGKVR